MPGVRIFNICCQAGQADNDIVEKAWQMTDISVLKSISGKNSGWLMANQNVSSKLATDKKISTKRTTAIYIARELIWKAGRWNDNGLEDFVRSIKPNVLYLPIYRSGYMCDVQQHVIKMTNCPVVCHITDDVYSYPPKPLSHPLKTMYYAWMRKKIKNIIQKSEYGEVFAQNMADEYSALFGKKFFVIGKGVDVDKLEKNTAWFSDDCITFVYTGNYGGERGPQLINLANAIAENFEPGKAEFRIYSTTSPDDWTDAQLAATGIVKLCGGVSHEEVINIQRSADYLVHVEGFSDKAIIETRMSFSTKLIDYMLAQRPILALGPDEVNSIQILRKNRIAMVASSNDELESVIKQISRNSCDSAELIKRATGYIKTNRDIKKIQSGIQHRLSTIVKNGY